MNVQTMTWKQIRRKWRGQCMNLPSGLATSHRQWKTFATVFDELSGRAENRFWQRNRRHGIALKRDGKEQREG